MVGLDLTGVRALLDSWIVDTVEIVRDNGSVDDALDPETGDIIPAAVTPVYTGEGAIQPLGGASALPDIDAMTQPIDSDTTHRLLLSLTVLDEIQVGDIVGATEIVAESSDPLLIGRKFKTTEVPSASSFAVVRIVFLKPV